MRSSLVILVVVASGCVPWSGRLPDDPPNTYSATRLVDVEMVGRDANAERLGVCLTLFHRGQFHVTAGAPTHVLITLDDPARVQVRGAMTADRQFPYDDRGGQFGVRDDGRWPVYGICSTAIGMLLGADRVVVAKTEPASSCEARGAAQANGSFDYGTLIEWMKVDAATKDANYVVIDEAPTTMLGQLSGVVGRAFHCPDGVNVSPAR